MHITSKGQVTIPIEIREKLGFLPNTEVEFYVEGEELKIKKKNSSKRGEKLIQKLTSKKFIKMTTDEIMALTRGKWLAIIVDSNVIIDVITQDKIWYEWSSNKLRECAETDALIINPIIYSEISIGFANIEDLEEILADNVFIRENMPWEAAFLAGKCYLNYRKNHGAAKTSPLPDFYIGAHACVTERALLTRDNRRYRGHFPKLEIISPT
jgi:AbrB family looped-hinge helix DNA binding protein